METSSAPSATASLTAAARSALSSELASTSRILQLWHTLWTISTSRLISIDQPEVSAGGSELGLPVWPTFLKQPFSVVHDGRP